MGQRSMCGSAIGCGAWTSTYLPAPEHLPSPSQHEGITKGAGRFDGHAKGRLPGARLSSALWATSGLRCSSAMRASGPGIGHGPVGRCASGVCGAIWLRYVSANLTFPRCKSSGPGCVQASGPTVLSMTWAATGDVGQARGRVGLSAESADGWVHGSRASCREVGRSRLRQGKRTARRCASVEGVLPPCLTPF